MEALLVILFFVACGYSSFRSTAWRPIRGASRLKHVKEAKKISDHRTNELIKIGKTTDAHKIRLGNLHIPLEELRKPFMIFGLPGSGKTSLISILVESLMKLFEKVPGRTRFIILDMKLDNLGRIHFITPPGIPIHVLNPFDSRGVALDWPSIFLTRAEQRQLAHMLCPELKSDQNPFFRTWARQIIFGVILVLQQNQKYARRPWTALDLCSILSNRKILRDVLFTNPETKTLYQTGLDPKNKSSADVFSTIRSVIQPFVEIALAEHQSTEKFNFAQFLSEDGVAVIGIPPKSSESVRPLYSVFLRRLIEEAQSNGHPDDRLFVILDEIAQLDPSVVNDAILKSVAVGRSHGIHLIAATQSIEILQNSFGLSKADAFLSCCATNIAFRSTRKTAEYLSGLFGNQEGFMTTSSQSSGPQGRTSGTSESFHSRPTVMPEEIMELPLADPINDSMAFYIQNPLVASVYVQCPFVEKVQFPRSKDYPDFLTRVFTTKSLPAFSNQDLKELGLSQNPHGRFLNP